MDGDNIRRDRHTVWGAEFGKGMGSKGKLLGLIARRWSLMCICGCVLPNPHPQLTCPPFLSPHLWPLCRLFIDGDRVDAPNVKEHLLFDLGPEAEYRIQVLPYKSILSELKALCASLSPREKVWVSDKASYAISEAIPKVGSPEAHPKSATFQLPAPSQFWHHSALSLKQRLFWKISGSGCQIRDVLSLHEPFGLEPY